MPTSGRLVVTAARPGTCPDLALHLRDWESAEAMVAPVRRMAMPNVATRALVV
jgi:hypothetical protein